MGTGRAARRLLGVAGIGAVALLSVGGPAGAQTPGLNFGATTVSVGQYSSMDPTPHAAAALTAAHYYGDTSYDAQAFSIAAQLADDAANGRPLNPDADRQAVRIAEEIYDKYVTQFVTDSLGGEANLNLAKTAAAFVAPEGCSNDYDFVTKMNLKTQLIDTNVADGQASVTLHLDRPLCTPVTFELQSWNKVGNQPWPAPQIVKDVTAMTVQEAGVYVWEVDTPMNGAEVCPSQLDFARTSGGFGPNGAIIPALIDFAQFDVNTPTTSAYSSWNYFASDDCGTPPPEVGGEQVETTTPPTQVAGVQTVSKPVSGTLAQTGSNTLPMLLGGGVLLLGGWLCLAGKSAMGAFTKK